MNKNDKDKPVCKILVESNYHKLEEELNKYTVNYFIEIDNLFEDSEGNLVLFIWIRKK